MLQRWKLHEIPDGSNLRFFFRRRNSDFVRTDFISHHSYIFLHMHIKCSVSTVNHHIWFYNCIYVVAVATEYFVHTLRKLYVVLDICTVWLSHWHITLKIVFKILK